MSDFYPTLKEASKATQELRIKSGSQYKRGRYKEDPRLCYSLDSVYKDQYIGEWDWNRFLGLEKRVEPYATLKEASQAAQSINIKSGNEYTKEKRYKEDPYLPSKPMDKYKNQYTGIWDWNRFLGLEKSVEPYATIIEASQAAQRLGIKGISEYTKKHRYREDPRLRYNPDKTYQNEWNEGCWSWKKFLGGDELYATLKEASLAAKNLELNKRGDYQNNGGYKLDPKLTPNPDKIYKNEWVKENWSWEKYLGLEEKSRHYLTLKEASFASVELGIKGRHDYQIKKIYKEDKKLPFNPEKAYQGQYDGKFSWNRFLKNGKNKLYSSIKEASQAVQKLGMMSSTEYVKRYKEDSRLPSNPDKTYCIQWDKENWTWPKFLGKTISNTYGTIKEASISTQRLNIKSGNEYTKEKRYKEDPQLPSNPIKAYKNQYNTKWNWPHFLGIDEKLQAIEGREKITLKEHIKKERNASLVKKIKEKRLAETGKLACDDCAHSFDEQGFDYIEAHHDSKMHSELSPEGELVSEDDFRLLCPNCHVIAHKKMES
ncbi:integrase repeat-containing protein [Lentisphaera profundi]|uniref:Integrase repeat-containing protein n=1 Tax=Lentisphaera profundi TaxID=1658616 RepID=A0ABY7W0L6_9BACT|nr:integrase repeat-containing protein [Lentisphaera profundi]WDE98529.1 integrase repeat-containing protein [Lentisphaera profundi]